MPEQTDPGTVIRALRRGLEMSQAELARAVGWSAAAISAWERGQSRPSSLAFKTILAFAAERGVRYRPRTAPRALVPSGVSESTLPGVSGAVRPEVVSDASADRGLRERVVSVTAERPRWTAEARFRVSVHPQSSPPSTARTALWGGGVAAATLCAALALGMPDRGVRRPPPPTRGAAKPVAAAVAPAAVPLRSEASIAARPAGHRQVRPRPSAAAARPTIAAPPVVADPVPVRTARLEAVLLLGEMRRATFQSGDQWLTVVEGALVGDREVRAIGPEGVTLVNRAGEARTVRVGAETALE